MKLFSSNGNLQININKLQSINETKISDADSTIVNANATFNSRVTTNFKGMFDLPKLLTLTSTFGSQPPVITQGYRYYYSSNTVSNAFCGLWQSGNLDGATITIINRGTTSFRIYGYGGWTTSSGVQNPDTKQYICDNKGNINPYITLGPADWVELVEQPSFFWGWIITEAVGI